METKRWEATLRSHGPRMTIELKCGPRPLLTANLPHPPRSPLALRGLLEALALWQDQILYVVCAVDEIATDGCIPGAVDEHPYVPHSPLVDVVVRPHGPDHASTDRQRGGAA